MNLKTILAWSIMIWLVWEHQQWLKNASDEELQNAAESYQLDREDYSP